MGGYAFFRGEFLTESAPYFQSGYPATRVGILVDDSVQAACSGGYPYMKESNGIYYVAGAPLQGGLFVASPVSQMTRLYLRSESQIKQTGVDFQDLTAGKNYHPNSDTRESVAPYLSTYLSSAFATVGAIIGAPASPLVSALASGTGAVAGAALGDLANYLLTKATAVPNDFVPPPLDTYTGKTITFYSTSQGKNFNMDVQITGFDPQDLKGGSQPVPAPFLDLLGYPDSLKGKVKDFLSEFKDENGNAFFDPAKLDALWDSMGMGDILATGERGKKDSSTPVKTSEVKTTVDLDKYFIYESKNVSQIIKDKALIANTYVDSSGGVDMLTLTNEFL